MFDDKVRNKVDELFDAITSSSEYQAYLNIGSVLEKNEEVTALVEEIKTLQQKSVDLEYHGDNSYQQVDKEIEEKVNKLNSIPVYQEYLRRMNEFNDILSQSSSTIEKYINSKI